MSNPRAATGAARRPRTTLTCSSRTRTRTARSAASSGGSSTGFAPKVVSPFFRRISHPPSHPSSSHFPDLIPEGGILSQSHSASLRTGADHKSVSALDSLDRAFVVLRHPPNRKERSREVYRRVDIVVSRWDCWGSALVGWTGSTQFERDLRTHGAPHFFLCLTRSSL